MDYTQPPIITLRQLEGTPPVISCPEARWFNFVAPELGQEAWVTSYEYPGPRFWQRRRFSVTRRAWVHDVSCFEIRQQSYDAQGNLEDEVANYQRLDRGFLRAFAGTCAEGDTVRITTWKDNGFDRDWGYDPGYPVRIADVGRWRFVDVAHFVDGLAATNGPDVSPNGAGLWEVSIGATAHRCLRVLEPAATPEGIMVEAFVDEAGRTVLARRYNGSRWRYGSGRYLVDGHAAEWTEILPDAPRLYYNDVCFVLWDFSVPDRALGGA